CITVEGLSPLQKVTLRASLTGENGEFFQSFAYYRAESNGELDLTCSSALAGSYSGTPFKRLAKNVLTPFYVHVEVFEGHDITNQLVGKCINEQKFLGEGAKRILVREGRLKATLFLPTRSGPFPGLIDLYGTGGALPEYRASLLASRGFVTLALTYLVFEDIPAFTDILELDYFGEAVEFLQKQQQLGGLGGTRTRPLSGFQPRALWIAAVYSASCNSCMTATTPWATSPWPPPNTFFILTTGPSSWCLIMLVLLSPPAAHLLTQLLTPLAPSSS
uniref:Acyl-CoA thioester hydrolase/bile acid-CoA amino acid N-acetyltransferase domain-containing protein n=1 Tax=Gopherus evgoodei TaxID=1825980 RepID=A0A8C4Y214_9SAUR